MRGLRWSIAAAAAGACLWLLWPAGSGSSPGPDRQPDRKGASRAERQPRAKRRPPPRILTQNKDDAVTAAIFRILSENGSLGEEKSLTEELRTILRSLTEEERKIVKLNIHLNRGEDKQALAVARDLMDSENADIRRLVAQAFGWIGAGALVDLTEMLRDADPSIVQEALENWKTVFDEMADEDLSADTLFYLLPTLDNRELIDYALMTVTRMATKTGLETVSGLIEDNKGNELLQDAAREMWSHLTGGEEYAGAASVNEYLARKAEEQRQAQLKWREVAAALEAGDEARVRELMGLPPETPIAQP